MRVRVRDVTTGDECLPVLGARGQQAAIDLDDRPVLRGSRALVLVAADLVRANVGQVHGRVELVTLRGRVAACDRAVLTWEPPGPGWLLQVEPFGAVAVEAVRAARGHLVTLHLPWLLRSRECVDVLVRNPYGYEQLAEVVLVIDAVEC